MHPLLADALRNQQPTCVYQNNEKSTNLLHQRL